MSEPMLTTFRTKWVTSTLIWVSELSCSCAFLLTCQFHSKINLAILWRRPLHTTPDSNFTLHFSFKSRHYWKIKQRSIMYWYIYKYLKYMHMFYTLSMYWESSARITEYICSSIFRWNYICEHRLVNNTCIYTEIDSQVHSVNSFGLVVLTCRCNSACN